MQMFLLARASLLLLMCIVRFSDNTTKYPFFDIQGASNFICLAIVPYDKYSTRY